jgi:hypothetical protein
MGKSLSLSLSLFLSLSFSLFLSLSLKEKEREREREREKERERKRERKKKRERKWTEWRVGSFASAFGSVDIQSHIIKLRTNNDFRGAKKGKNTFFRISTITDPKI